MKNNIKRILLTMVAAILLVVMSVAGTLAYLTATSQEVKNTFTVGNVNITLDEAKVNADGQDYLTNHDNRVTENTYKLQPGLKYLKDPTVTVEDGSEDSYIRILVTVGNYSGLATAFPKATYETWWAGDVFMLQYVVEDWDGNTWLSKGCTIDTTNNTATYEFWYYDEVNAQTADNEPNRFGKQLPDLFTAIILPDDMTNTELAGLNGVSINLVAHAIQSEGFASQADAWKAWVDTGADNIMPVTPTAAPTATPEAETPDA